MKIETYLKPEWPAPKNIKAFYTTRQGGNSLAPYDSFNLSNEIETDPCVPTNRLQLQHDLALPHAVTFLKQVHGTRVIDPSNATDVVADAAYTRQAQHVCAVLTADCLPLLVTNAAGTEVAAIHAGWCGLLAGVIDETIRKFQSPAAELLVWLGPAIGPCHFEVDTDVYESYLAKDAANQSDFETRGNQLFANLFSLARLNLQKLGITQIYGGNVCTYCEEPLFYSYRRDEGQTGRMASLIWLEKY